MRADGRGCFGVIIGKADCRRRSVRMGSRAGALVILAGLASAAHAEIVIAVAGPSSGREAGRTSALLKSAREAAAAINASGGVSGETLGVISADDGCARDTAAAAAAELAARNVALVLGHACASAALAAADVYGKSSVLFIATVTRHPALTAKRAGPTIFRLSGRDDRQGELAGRLLARVHDGSRVAVIHDRTRYGSELAASAAAAFKRERGSEPIVATIIGGDKDYKLTIAKVKNAAIVFFAGFPLEGGLIYAGLRDSGSTAEFIGSDSLDTQVFATTFGARAKGVRVLVSSAAATLSNMADEPGFAYADAAEDAARIGAAIEAFAAAARRASSNDADKISAALASGAFATALGPISFSESGDALIPSYQVVEWQGDGWGPAAAAP